MSNLLTGACWYGRHHGSRKQNRCIKLSWNDIITILLEAILLLTKFICAESLNQDEVTPHLDPGMVTNPMFQSS